MDAKGLNLKSWVPNALTLGNLAFGCVAVLLALRAGGAEDSVQELRMLQLAAWAIVGGAVCDLLDGMVARAMGVSSKLGAELDSLSDLVTFGVAPAAIYSGVLFRLTGGAAPIWLQALPFVLALAASLRLAQFNIDTTQTVSFSGLPSPGSALFTVGLVLGLTAPLGAKIFRTMLGCEYAIMTWVVLQSALMLVPVRMLSFKIHGSGWRAWWHVVVLGVVAIAGYACLRGGVAALVVAVYCLLSPFAGRAAAEH